MVYLEDGEWKTKDIIYHDGTKLPQVQNISHLLRHRSDYFCNKHSQLKKRAKLLLTVAFSF